MSTINIYAWCTGDVDSFVNSIQTVNEIFQLLPLVYCPESPRKKHDLLMKLDYKFGLSLPAVLWLRLITQDDNSEIFSYFYQTRTALFLEDTQMLFNHLIKSSACAWEFCRISSSAHQNVNQNISSLGVFEKAVEHSIQGHQLGSPIIKERILIKLQLIWNVPLLYKFHVLHLIGPIIPNKLELLYSDHDIINAVSTPNLTKINYLPVVDVIIKNINNIYWKVDQQIKILADLAETGTPTDRQKAPHILSSLMPIFSTSQQRHVWKGLTADQREFYEDLDWSGIHSDVVPPYFSMGSSLYKLLKQKKRIYDYESLLVDYCVESNPSVLKESLQFGLLKINNKNLWNTENTHLINLLISYWIGHNTTESELATQYIITMLGKADVGQQVKSEVFKHIDGLINRFPGNSEIFKVLLRDPLPANFKPSLALRQHVFCHIPSLMTVKLYNDHKSETITSIVKNNLTISDIELAEVLLKDILSGKVPYIGALFNAIPLAVWQKLQKEQSEDVFNFMLNGITAGVATTDAAEATAIKTYIHPKIIAELSRKLQPKVPKMPDPQYYIKYVVQHYGLSELDDIMSDLILTEPQDLCIEIKENNYTELFLLYDHYKESGATNMLTIQKEVLIDMLTKHPDSHMAHAIFFKYCKKYYNLDSETIAEIPHDLLMDHCDYGLIQLTPSQERYFTQEMLSKLKPNCGLCNSIRNTPPGTLVTPATLGLQMTKLLCGHKFHAGCVNMWSNVNLDSGTLCPTCKKLPTKIEKN